MEPKGPKHANLATGGLRAEPAKVAQGLQAPPPPAVSWGLEAPRNSCGTKTNILTRHDSMINIMNDMSCHGFFRRGSGMARTAMTWHGTARGHPVQYVNWYNIFCNRAKRSHITCCFLVLC